MVNPIGSSLYLSNPFLNFRLDPGETGILRTAQASDSTVLVTAQEQGNAARLSADAARAGQEVTRREINYTTRRVGDVTTVTDGRTTVATRPDNTPGIVPSPELPFTDPRAEIAGTDSSSGQHEGSLELSLLDALAGVAFNTDTGSNLLIPEPSPLLAEVRDAQNLTTFRQYFPGPQTNVSVVNVEGEEQAENAPVKEEAGPEIETFV
ncbi:MAG: hypothetical protein E3J72_17215 [Planctomycetota bacterium]|nr:MAG: hypothetical protein E3J72_17215 [Planctomycetota bacterium]